MTSEIPGGDDPEVPGDPGTGGDDLDIPGGTND
jgi:hypothetical protein